MPQERGLPASVPRLTRWLHRAGCPRLSPFRGSQPCGFTRKINGGTCECSRIEVIRHRYVIVADQAVPIRRPERYGWIEGKDWLKGRRQGPQSREAHGFLRLHHEMQLYQTAKRAQQSKKQTA